MKVGGKLVVFCIDLFYSKDDSRKTIGVIEETIAEMTSAAWNLQENVSSEISKISLKIGGKCIGVIEETKAESFRQPWNFWNSRIEFTEIVWNSLKFVDSLEFLNFLYSQSLSQNVLIYYKL